MIITQVPFRVSFFGGGTDFPAFYNEYGGKVISTSIDKYCYLNVRHLPPFFDYSTNITYCLMDAYFAGKVLYPDQFADVDMRTKGNEILTEFLGSAFFDEMEADGLYYGKLTLGE